MTSFFPDLNVWLALTVEGHARSEQAWRWTGALPTGARLLFSRYTQLGLLRLLTNKAVMGSYTLTLNKAWRVYDRWLADTRVEFRREPRNLEDTFREVTRPFSGQSAPQAFGDSYLLAFAASANATLVTFDGALHALAVRQGRLSLIPGGSR
ncbi:MAG: TA system VapC family ribonuclease toxin [Bryobacteraceae bacterium]|nr:TA system VapC family ribonuclease toxin [Bryobacteraceae bacterium]